MPNCFSSDSEEEKSVKIEPEVNKVKMGPRKKLLPKSKRPSPASKKQKMSERVKNLKDVKIKLRRIPKPSPENCTRAKLTNFGEFSHWLDSDSDDEDGVKITGSFSQNSEIIEILDSDEEDNYIIHQLGNVSKDQELSDQENIFDEKSSSSSSDDEEEELELSQLPLFNKIKINNIKKESDLNVEDWPFEQQAREEFEEFLGKKDKNEDLEAKKQFEELIETKDKQEEREEGELDGKRYQLFF